MKKLICILLALCMVLALAACGGNTATTGQTGGETPGTDSGVANDSANSGSAAENTGSTAETAESASQPAAEPAEPEDPMDSTLVLGASGDFTGEGKNLVFDRLLWRINSYEASPYVVTSEHNDNYTEFTLTVTPGITFTDGTPVTADVVKYSIESQVPTAAIGFGGLIDSIEVIDDSTLVMKLTDPYMNLEYDLTYIFCVKPGAISEEGNFMDWTGTGPFILTEHQQDVSATLTRNEDYWNEAKKPANVKTVVWKVLPDENTRVMALEAHEVDVLGPSSHAASNLSNNILKDIQAKGELTIMSRDGSSPATYMYNYTNGPMSDIELRKAVTYALDRQGFVDVVTLGFGHAMGTFLSPDDKYSNRNGEEYTYDPDLARQILADAGYVDNDGDGIVEKDGQNIVLRFVTMSGDVYRTIGVLFKDYLAQVGIGCEVFALERNAFLERTSTGDMDICMCHPWTTAIAYFTWRGAYSDYDNFGPGFGVNDKFPDYLNTILTSTDEEEIQATFDKVWADIYAAYVATPLYAGIGTFVYTDDVEGFIWSRGTDNVIDFSEVVIHRG